MDDTAIAELTGGTRDVFAAARADPLSGLHGPPGKPCPARPWVCLLCPLAVFTPRHAANLLRLKGPGRVGVPGRQQAGDGRAGAGQPRSDLGGGQRCPGNRRRLRLPGLGWMSCSFMIRS